MALEMQLHTIGKDEKVLIYWQQANGIRQWIIKHAGLNPKMQVSTRLSKHDIADLIDDMQTVIRSDEKAKASEILPTSSGYGFGSMDYDVRYFVDLINSCLALKTIHSKMADDEMLMYAERW
jgi:hypothetical protein